MTLADAWTDHADRTLPIDASQAQVLRARREWYYAQLERLGRMQRGPADEALFQEALGFARAIGTQLEAA